MDAYAFADSGLSGEVTFGVNGYYSYLARYAFKNCRNITAVTVNGTIVDLEEGCFENCSALVNVTLADFDTYYVGAVLHSAIFSGSSGIKTLNLPGGEPFGRFGSHRQMESRAARERTTPHPQLVRYGRIYR